MIRRLWRRTPPCVIWPCRRCDQAGRTSWRSREAWHAERRHRRLVNASVILAGGVGLAAGVAWAVLTR